MRDNWIKGPRYNCESCAHYLNYRCRRHAPRGQEGWPAVFSTDFCGDHKMDKNTMADIELSKVCEAKSEAPSTITY